MISMHPQQPPLHHGPPEVMARLARGQDVPPQDCFFRTLVRLTTGHANGLQLYQVVAIANGRREARRAVLDFWRVG